MVLEYRRGKGARLGDLAVVIGAGRSGMAVARLMRSRGARVRLLERDPGTLAPDSLEEMRALGIEIQLGEHGPEQFSGASFVVPSPGMPVRKVREILGNRQLLGSSGPEIVSEMEMSWRYLENEPVLAITGTSGKTTTASLAAAMLQAQGYNVFLGGNIGTPLSEYVLSGRKADVLVIEASSFQLQACNTFCPRVGVVLNISPNHLDYHSDMAEYSEAKFRMFRCQDEGDLAILGPGVELRPELEAIRSRKIRLSDVSRFPETKLLGAHNSLNAEAAWQACRVFGVSESNAAKAVARFRPLPHRLEKVAVLDGVTYINDSKCTTVASLEVALKAMEGPVNLLCGGKYKGGDLGALSPLIREKVRNIALFGASRANFETAWQGLVPISWHATLKEAVCSLAHKSSPGDIVLLSPATSSFDLYANYMERGEDFKKIVGSLR